MTGFNSRAWAGPREDRHGSRPSRVAPCSPYLLILALLACTPGKKPAWDCVVGLDGDQACWDTTSIRRHGNGFTVREEIVFRGGEELPFYVRADCSAWTSQSFTTDLEPMGPATKPAVGSIVEHFMKKYCQE